MTRCNLKAASQDGMVNRMAISTQEVHMTHLDAASGGGDLQEWTITDGG
jgi:hypothetical protein